MQAGDSETGVSLAFTVRAMDAGPVLATECVTVAPDVQAPQLLEQLFDRGCRWAPPRSKSSGAAPVVRCEPLRAPYRAAEQLQRQC